MKVVVFSASSSRLPYSMSLSGSGIGHMSRLKACSRQYCGRCSAVMMSALHGHTNLDFNVHVGSKSVVSSSQPEQNNLLWSV